MRLPESLRNAGLALLHIAYPNRCRACGADLAFDDPLPLCAFCLARVRPVLAPFCLRCGIPLPDGGERCFRCRKDPPAFELCRSWAVFDGPVRELVHKLKYSGRRELARPLAAFLSRAWKDFPELGGAEALVPVPLHPVQLRERGYNQSELLARELARALGGSVPQVEAGVLRKARSTPSQAGLSRDERLTNLSGTFAAESKALRGKTVCLVDDVCTTGATLSECARTLKAAGAKAVLAATLARDL